MSLSLPVRVTRTLALVVLAAVSMRVSEVSAQGIVGTTWTLFELGGEPDDLEPPITLVFADDASVSGSDGCNRYRGACAIQGSKLRVDGELAVTMMACSESLERRAVVWHRALKRVASFDRTGAELALKDAGGQPVATLRQASTSIQGLWTVVAYNNGEQAVVSVRAGSEITAVFGANGRVTGKGGCNRYFADYRTEGDTITIGRLGSTQMHCPEPEGVMEQESLFLAALDQSATFQLEADRLTLRSTEGSIQVTLTVGGESRRSDSDAKIKFDRRRLDEEGLQGSADGLRALHYEYCIPDRPEVIAKVAELDHTLETHRESPGRVGCGDGQLLCLGNTHQPNWRKTLDALAALPEIQEIREAVFE